MPKKPHNKRRKKQRHHQHTYQHHTATAPHVDATDDDDRDAHMPPLVRVWMEP